MAGSSKTVLLTTSAPPDQTPFSTTEKRPPIGIGFLISMLKNAGHRVLFTDNYLFKYDLPDADFLNSNKIDYYGIYLNTICFRHASAVMHRLDYLRKSKQWMGKIIVGGPHTTVALQTIPDFVDFIVQGEGEQAIVDIVEGKVSERIVRYPRIMDLDILPMPAWDIFTSMPYNWDCNFFQEKPVFTMNTSRGCPFRCAFCSVCSIWGKQYTMFSAERVVADIEYLVSTYGAKGIYFREDNFTLNKKRLERFCNLMIEKGINIPWVCESRVNTLTRDLVELMAKSGVKGFYFGVESGSPRMLEFMQKDITVDQIRQAFAWCHEFNISTAASIVTGLPTETPDDLQETQKLIAEIKPSITWYNVFVGIPTSKLYQYSLDNKLYEFIDDRGLVYLKGHDKRTSQFYGSRWDSGVPVKIDDNGNVINPVISVVMSVYNGEKYLAQAIRSVLGQSFPNFEFIIVNDASTDRSEEIIKNFDDPRIKLVRNESNIGLTSSLVKGFSLAKGKYVARMDADDISLPHRFETEVHFLDTHQDYALVGSSYYLINDTGEKQGIIPVLLCNDELKKELPGKNWFCHGSILIRKTAYDSVGGYSTDFRCAQDYDLWLRIAEQFKIENIEEPLYCWRDSPECVSRANAEEQQMFAARAKENAVLRRASKVTVNDKRPLVSIIVPTFNRPHLIGNTIQSILNQTYPNLEIVIVNDCGSPVENIVYHLNNKNNIVYVRHSVNAGLAAARNTGIRTARGDYIGYLDDDDIYYPQHVETLVDFIIKNKVQIAYTDACRATQSLVNGIWETMERQVLYSMDFNNDTILIRNMFPVLCILHEKKCIDTVGGFDESFKTHEDWDLWLRMSRKYVFHHIKKITAEYIVRRGTSEQMTTNPVSNFNETRKKIYQKYADLIIDRPDIIKAQEVELMNNDPRMFQEQMLIRLNEFIENVSILIEKGDLQGGLKLFDAHRNKYPDSIPELVQIDTIINKLRSKIK
jgi:radical SAM superfamily enzyme YgiQ (UPF0313 family)/glycosyltransferase involved in cell wall biosynthesis